AIGEEISELTLAVVAHRFVQGDGCLDDCERFCDVLLLIPAHRCKLFRGRLAAVLDLELASAARELESPFVHVGQVAERGILVRNSTLTGLPDPPGRVRRELAALAPVELLDRAVETDDALLDQVTEGDSVSAIALGDRDDEAKVRIEHALLRLTVAPLDA